MKLYIINLLTTMGVVSQISDINKVFTLVLIVTAVLVNLKKLFEKK